MSDYTKVSNSIAVTVTPVYLDDESLPADSHYVWVYHVRLQNQGNQTVQLMNRYWHITDSFGHIQEVRGPGVIGKQPVLKPGDIFEYASGTHLPTPSGIMRGHYEMQTLEGKVFEIEIPTFSLDSPEQISKPN